MPDSSELTVRTGEILEVLAGVEEKHPLTLAGIHSIRSEAVKKVASERGIARETVAEKCWRGLGLAGINEFDDLLWGWLNRGDTKLRDLVLSRIPSDATDTDHRAVEQFFSEKKRVNVWWVNQGSTWKEETEGGYVWAPKANKAGHVQGHHHSVNRLRENDVIINHWDGYIRGFSLVTTDGTEGSRPSELPSEIWGSNGFIGKVNYLALEDPISTKRIPLEWRVEESYAFNVNGGVNQNYLVPISAKFWSAFINGFDEELPGNITSMLGRERLLRFMEREFREETFDETERDYKLEIASRVIEFIDEIESERAQELLKSVFASPNNLIDWRPVQPLLNAVSEQGLDSLKDALIDFPEETEYAHQRLGILDQWLEELNAGVQPASRLRIASLFLSSLSPDDDVFVMSQPFLEVEELYGWESIGSATVIERYLHHLRFAKQLRSDLEIRGCMIRDMIDVQSLIYIASQNVEKITGDPFAMTTEEQLLAALVGDEVTLDELSEATFTDRADLEELEAILKERKQIILEGPPGSGKTFIAEKFARYFTGNSLNGPTDNCFAVVQFHQTYGYEDFVQGIRPSTDQDGNLRYDVKPGTFKQLCGRAADDTENNYVIMIDEINRGNIARILGELLYLLEYRDKSIRLAYSEQDDELFSIPENVYLIGTMNTTDRSLTPIDYALRRRFYFYRLMPTIDGEAPVLNNWLDNRGVSGEKKSNVLRLFLKLNQRLTEELGEHFQIGHSYFMREGIETRAMQDQIMTRAITPLLEEYFYSRQDRSTVLERFSIDALIGDEE